MALLFVVRHGQTDWNRERRIQGFCDRPLDPTGHEQAATLARRVAREFGEVLPTVFTSDLLRAVQTAEPMAEALGAGLSKSRCLRERGLGVAEGKTWGELERELPQAVGDYRSGRDRDALPQSEPLDDFRRRVLQGIEKIARQADSGGGPGIVVTHGGVVHVLLEEALGRGRRFTIPNAGMYRLEVSGRTIRRLPTERLHPVE